MTRVDFYVLQAEDRNERLQFAARLTDKAWQQGCKVQLRAADAAMVAEMNALLWRIRPESFIPHGDDAASGDPVVVSLDSVKALHRDLLINLADDVPENFGEFQRLAEIVIQAPDVLTSTRHHFGHYRERGYQVNTHKL